MADNPDVSLAVKTILAKAKTHQVYWDYYDGNQRLKYVANRLAEVFRAIDARFADNWCETAVETPLNRMTLRGFETRDKRANQMIKDVWNQNEMNLDAHDCHLDALITGEGYIIAWPGEDVDDVYQNDARMVHLFYDPSRPKVKRMAAKLWKEDEKVWRLTLYYPDHLEYYMAETDNLSESTPFDRYQDDGENTYGEVPVFHFRTARRNPKSMLKNLTDLQDALNKLFADMMVAAEYGAFKQRYVISSADTSTLKNKPGAVWDLPAAAPGEQQTIAGEFSETSLQGYLEAMEKIGNSIAKNSKVPKHYFISGGTSGLSGDALIALEAPLVKLVETLEEMFASAWKPLIAFLLRGKGVQINPDEIMPVWSNARSVQPVAESQAIQAMTNSGIPLAAACRRLGWTSQEIDQMLAEKAAEEQRKAELSAQLLAEARRAADSQNSNGAVNA